MWNGTPRLVRTEPLVSKYPLSSIREWPWKDEPCAVCKTPNGVQLKTRCQNWEIGGRPTTSSAWMVFPCGSAVRPEQHALVHFHCTARAPSSSNGQQSGERQCRSKDGVLQISAILLLRLSLAPEQGNDIVLSVCTLVRSTCAANSRVCSGGVVGAGVRCHHKSIVLQQLLGQNAILYSVHRSMRFLGGS